jgi:hypothetical protein
LVGIFLLVSILSLITNPSFNLEREVAALAFEVLETPAKISRVPAWLMWSVVYLVKLFNPHQGDLFAFFTTMATNDIVASPTGTHTLEAHYRTLGGKQ